MAGAVLATLPGMWTLYGSKGSGSAAIEMALLLCKLPFQEVRASTWEADSAQAALRAVNPLGQIPTLVAPDGMVLTESAAVLIHLGLLCPGSGLLPADPNTRAQVLRGLVFAATNCYTAIGIIDYPERWLPQGRKSGLDDLRKGARERLHQCWDVFADQFGSLIGGGADTALATPDLAPAQATALDLLAAVVSRWSGARAHLAQSHPAVLQALQRVESHAVLQPVFARHWPAATTDAGVA